MQYVAAVPAPPRSARRTATAFTPFLTDPSNHDVSRSSDDHGGPPFFRPAEAGGLNQIAAACAVEFDRRTVPPETITEFVASLESHLEARRPEEFDFEVNPDADGPDPDAFATDIDVELVQSLADVSGGAKRPFGVTTEESYFPE